MIDIKITMRKACELENMGETKIVVAAVVLYRIYDVPHMAPNKPRQKNERNDKRTKMTQASNSHL